jgi:ElaB/YqjD/DUF883 family membrane-anchored ribosome-binding protein
MSNKTDSATSTRTDESSGSGVRERAAEAYSAARERTSSAYSDARDRVGNVGQRTADTLQSNPVAAVIGGIALGGLVAYLLPNTRRETETLGNVGTKLTDTARQAAQTAVDAGKQQVNEIKETAATKVGQAVMEAVSSATTGGSTQQ